MKLNSLHPLPSLRWICAVKIAGWEEPETAYEPFSLDSWQLRANQSIVTFRFCCPTIQIANELKLFVQTYVHSTVWLTIQILAYGFHRFEFPLPNLIGGNGVAFLLALELRVRMGPELAADVHRQGKICQQSAQLSQWRRVTSCSADLEKNIGDRFTMIHQFQAV